MILTATESKETKGETKVETEEIDDDEVFKQNVLESVMPDEEDDLEPARGSFCSFIFLLS